MTQFRDEDDEEESNEDFDREGPDPSEMDYSDEPDLEVCPYCRKMILEDAERCPHCGEYVSAEDAPMPRWAWVAIVIGVITLLAFVFTHAL